jgi:hypothetical protein
MKNAGLGIFSPKLQQERTSRSRTVLYFRAAVLYGVSEKYLVDSGHTGLED